MDNEASTDLKSAMTKYKLTYQLVPPSMHRRNAAEKAIRTYKNHFITGLTLLDPDFPMPEWDRLVEQSVITLNHLRNARANPKLSSHAYLFGTFDFNRCPMAPPGTKVVVHSKPDKRASWDTHGIEGWYVGPSLEHYRCVKCYMPLTSAERDSDTVAFFPHSIPFPAVTTDDFLRQSITDIVSLLKNSPPSTVPSLQAGDATTAAIQQIAKLLNRHCKKPTPVDLSIQTDAQPTPTPIQLSPVSIPNEQPVALPAQLPRVQQFPHSVQLPRVNKYKKARTQPVRKQKVPLPSTMTFNLPPINIPTPKGHTRSSTYDLRDTPTPRKIFQPMHHYRDASRNFRSTAVQLLKAQHIAITEATPFINHIYNAETGKKETLVTLLKGKDNHV